MSECEGKVRLSLRGKKERKKERKKEKESQKERKEVKLSCFSFFLSFSYPDSEQQHEEALKDLDR